MENVRIIDGSAETVRELVKLGHDTARFRTVLRGPQLTLGYQMIRPQAVIDAVLGQANDLITEEAQVPVFSGSVA